MANSIQTISLRKPRCTLIPLFLCPLLASCSGVSHGLGRRLPRPQSFQLHVDATAKPSPSFQNPSQLLALPRSCPGCGAFAQNASPEQPGFYGTNRKSVKAFIGPNGQCPSNEDNGESKVFERVLGAADASLLSQIGLQGGGENKTNGQISYA